MLTVGDEKVVGGVKEMTGGGGGVFGGEGIAVAEARGVGVGVDTAESRAPTGGRGVDAPLAWG